jgi:hypothetical protein
MKINLTPVSKGSYVDIFADILPEKDDKSEYALVANAITFSSLRLYEATTHRNTLLTLPVKEARQFARTLLALTRQDGDVENEREKEIRELKGKNKTLENRCFNLEQCNAGEGSKNAK